MRKPRVKEIRNLAQYLQLGNGQTKIKTRIKFRNCSFKFLSLKKRSQNVKIYRWRSNGKVEANRVSYMSLHIFKDRRV